MAKTIAHNELRYDNVKIIDAVVAGESFVITRNGVPVAELRPIELAHRKFVPRAEVLALAKAGPPVSIKQFRADLDGLVNQDL